ncbi:helix-turn-helix transcriptional regulator [Streptomyces sp. HNM0575]|uniref:TetR/AcrR family transcriptional regulator n=1 Tax=Streptomyces sp. HNM0575 TaxID=2716338 RepID=UPI00145D6CD0|nr:helix-turn-helix domain-containing protein [Streptomyces sp. HNM0575]NLU76385.1 helix-turn-helix transcriptional regulator [Streptomyces sp. HNM0575]
MSAAPDNGSQGAGDGESGIGAVGGTTSADKAGGAGLRGRAAETATAPRPTPLRVDAQRNLEHVLRAAREVFGELGYGAPMEDVARRARVGVGTVYRRFPSKDVLVRRIAAEETARLTEQARTALGQEQDPWSALSRFLRTSVASGAGRLLPPRILRADGWGGDASGAEAGPARVPQQRQAAYGQQERSGLRLVEDGTTSASASVQRQDDRGGDGLEGYEDDSGCAELLGVVGQMVQRTREAGELRDDVTVGDVLLVIATAAPSLPDAAQQAAASRRLLDILLEGLRPRPQG